MTVKILQGDALTVLKTLPNESVNCCVTSPPYWGLRDYGVDGQLGLERTPEEYVSKMVEVFREVRRVLRKDGTLWLNLGISYARDTQKGQHKPGDAGKQNYIIERGGGRAASCFDGKRPSRSPLLQRVPACDSDGKGFQGSQVSGRACPCSGGGPQDEIQTHHGGIAHNDRSVSQDEQPTSQIDHDNALAGCVQEPRRFLQPDVRESTIEKSSCLPSGAFSPEATASASPKEQQTTSPESDLSAHRLAYTSGTSQMLPPLVVRTVGKESFFSACRRSDCNGIGRCGLCWCSLSIPTLNVKPKDELNIPHLVAMAIQADGWLLRQTIIWSKNNPMPESVTDRCTKSHEYIFLMSKSQRYFYDAKAIAEYAIPGKHITTQKSFGTQSAGKCIKPSGNQIPGKEWFWGNKRNRRSVWTVSTAPFPGAHFATFPPKLIEPCILAGCPKGGTVLDPFGGSGTVGMVAENNGRNSILIELNEKYIDMIKRRTAQSYLFN